MTAASNEAGAGREPATERQLVTHRIAPPSSWSAVNLREIWTYRDTFAILAQRDLKVRYKQTVIGVAWIVLQPLLSAVIMAAVFGNLAKLPSGGVPYILFVFAAMLPWNLLSAGLNRGGNSLLGDASLISKVYFPRIIIPTASLFSGLVDFGVTLAVMVVLCFIYGIGVSPTWLAVVPLTFLALTVILGASLFFSSMSVYYRDFRYLLPFTIQAWMYVSPVVYTSSLVPAKWQTLYYLNPMAGIIDGFRWALLGGRDVPLTGMLLAIPGTVAVLLVGLWVFQRVERTFADVI